jgi:hypothetical protein
VRYRSSTVRPEVDRTNRDLLDFERGVVEVAIVDIRLIIEFAHGGLAETLFRRKASIDDQPDPPQVWIVLVSAKWTALGRNKKGSKSWRQRKPC